MRPVDPNMPPAPVTERTRRLTIVLGALVSLAVLGGLAWSVLVMPSLCS